MPASLTWLEEDDATPASSLVFAGVVGGSPTAEQVRHAWNGQGLVSGEPLINARLVVLARLPGEDVFQLAGTRWLDERWFRVRLTGGTDGVDVVDGADHALGAGAYLVLPEIPVDSAVYAAVWLDVPMTFDGPLSIEFKVAYTDDPAIPIGSGHSEFGPDGVMIGLGDGGFSGLFIGGACAAAGTPDDTVAVDYAGGVSAGMPLGAPAGVETLDDTDGAAATLASGQAYAALISVSPAGRTVTKGNKAAIGATVRPSVPVGAVPLAWVNREFDGSIDPADITDAREFSRYRWTSSALLGSISAGQGQVDNFWAYRQSAQDVPLEDDASVTVWLSNSGSPVASVSPPSPRALPLYGIDTAGGVVTGAVRDLRAFVGATPAPLTFRLDTGSPLAVNDVSAPALVTGNRPLMIDPEAAAAAALDDMGTVGVSGASVFDVEYDPDGSDTWLSIYLDAADTRDIGLMLSVPFDAFTGRASSPTVCVIPAGSRVRVRVAAIPTGATAPSGATATLLGWTR